MMSSFYVILNEVKNLAVDVEVNITNTKYY